MIVLYGFGLGFGLPDPSPYPMKVEILLQLAGLTYTKATGGMIRAPKHKLPFIEDEGELVADSTFIREHLERKYGVDFDEGLGASEQAQAWAIERMVEDHLYWAMVHDRWMIEENFRRGPSQFANFAPEDERDQVRAEMRERVRTALWGQGIGRHSSEEVTALAARSLGALSTLLGRRPYMMGDRPCGADASVYGHLAAILTPLFDSPVRRAAEAHPNLVAYVERMTAQFFPDFVKEPEAA